MSDWQVGDLAACVELNPQTLHTLGALQVGLIYRVTHVEHEPFCWLCIDGARSSHPTGGYRAFRFRKIRPDAHEDCEPEFVELLNRIKRKSPANA